jgi:hypothetical protein
MTRHGQRTEIVRAPCAGATLHLDRAQGQAPHDRLRESKRIARVTVNASRGAKRYRLIDVGPAIAERNGTQARPILRRDAAKLFDAARRTYAELGVTPIALLNNCDMDSGAHFRSV